MPSNPFVIHPPYRVFYSHSISFCTASAVRSIEVVSEVMKNLSSTDIENPLDNIDQHAILDELQNIIVQGAAVSRYFWPSNKSYEARGKELRKNFRVIEGSALESRTLRNMIEHFDEKLDDYLVKGIVGHIIPHYFGPEIGNAGIPQHFFRAYFINTGIFEILGKRFEIEPIATELLRLHKVLSLND